MQDIYLIAQIAGEEVAIESKYVESVVHVQDVVAAPQSDKSVVGIFALRSRVLTLIDSKYVVTEQSGEAVAGSPAIIVEIAGYSYGLLVEKAEDVVSILPSMKIDNISAVPKWQKIVKEFAVLDGKTIMIVDPNTLVSSAELLAA